MKEEHGETAALHHTLEERKTELWRQQEKEPSLRKGTGYGSSGPGRQGESTPRLEGSSLRSWIRPTRADSLPLPWMKMPLSNSLREGTRHMTMTLCRFQSNRVKTGCLKEPTMHACAMEKNFRFPT